MMDYELVRGRFVALFQGVALGHNFFQHLIQKALKNKGLAR